jgi:hypothetical protein
LLNSYQDSWFDYFGDVDMCEIKQNYCKNRAPCIVVFKYRVFSWIYPHSWRWRVDCEPVRRVKTQTTQKVRLNLNNWSVICNPCLRGAFAILQRLLWGYLLVVKCLIFVGLMHHITFAKSVIVNGDETRKKKRLSFCSKPK